VHFEGLAVGRIVDRNVVLVHPDDARRPQLAVVPAEVSDLLSGMQLRAHLDEAPWVGQQLLDDPTELVQLGAARHGQLFDQFDAHEHILPRAAGACAQAASGMSFAPASASHFAATTQGSNSSVRLIGWSAMRSRTWHR